MLPDEVWCAVCGLPFAALVVFCFAFYHIARERWWPKRPTPNKCEHCGYATIGLTTDICPECGKPHSPSQR